MPSHMNDPHSVEIGMGIIHMRTMPILGKSGLLMLRSGQEVLLARQNGVENHSHHERHRDAVGSEDGLEQRRAQTFTTHSIILSQKHITFFLRVRNRNNQ